VESLATLIELKFPLLCRLDKAMMELFVKDFCQLIRSYNTLTPTMLKNILFSQDFVVKIAATPVELYDVFWTVEPTVQMIDQLASLHSSLTEYLLATTSTSSTVVIKTCINASMQLLENSQPEEYRQVAATIRKSLNLLKALPFTRPKDLLFPNLLLFFASDLAIPLGVSLDDQLIEPIKLLNTGQVIDSLTSVTNLLLNLQSNGEDVEILSNFYVAFILDFVLPSTTEVSQHCIKLVLKQSNIFLRSFASAKRILVKLFGMYQPTAFIKQSPLAPCYQTVDNIIARTSERSNCLDTITVAMYLQFEEERIQLFLSQFYPDTTTEALEIANFLSHQILHLAAAKEFQNIAIVQYLAYWKIFVSLAKTYFKEVGSNKKLLRLLGETLLKSELCSRAIQLHLLQQLFQYLGETAFVKTISDQRVRRLFPWIQTEFPELMYLTAAQLPAHDFGLLYQGYKDARKYVFSFINQHEALENEPDVVSLSMSLQRTVRF
jgi:hypothetical protein